MDICLLAFKKKVWKGLQLNLNVRPPLVSDHLP